MRPATLPLVLTITLGAVSAYASAYFAARATHVLVRYDGFVARPHVVSGLGASPAEVVFAPAIWAEDTVRAHAR